MALESFPPLLLVSLRFLLSGTIMLLVLAARGLKMPRGRDLWNACFSGFLILGIGNGALVFAELQIPSGLAGLFITISPFWMVGLEAISGGEKLHAPTVIGMLVGLSGAGLLVAQDLLNASMSGSILAGFLILQLGMASWSIGSIYQRRKTKPGLHPILIGAVNQLAAGLAFAPLAALVPEPQIVWSGRGIAAIFYLVTFGSIVGYSSYVYALDRLPVAIVSIYPYVNSVVAVALGWLFYREPFGPREAAAMAIIFAGVALVKRHAQPAAANPNANPND